MTKIRQQIDFGRAVSAIKKRLGLNQTELAALLGCRQNTISQYESGVIHPSPEVVVAASKLADRTERILIAAYLSELYTDAEMEGKDVLELFHGNSARASFLHRVVEIAKLPKIPEVIGDFLGLYLSVGNMAGAEEAFLDAVELAAWKLEKLKIAAGHAAADVEEAALDIEEADITRLEQAEERQKLAVTAAVQGTGPDGEKVAAVREIEIHYKAKIAKLEEAQKRRKSAITAVIQGTGTAKEKLAAIREIAIHAEDESK